MSTHFTKLTSKAQTTVPKAVRDALGVRPGDTLVYKITTAGVSVARAEPLDRDYLKSVEATLSEWNSAEDAAAFDGL